MILPNGLGRTHCREFLDDGYHCTYGKNCGFKHSIFPKDFSKSEVTDIVKWLNNTEGLSLKNGSQPKPENKSRVSNKR